MLHKHLDKYWLVFNGAPNYPLGVGVTAYSVEDAENLVSESLFQGASVPAYQISIIQSLNELEQNHVLPNIGLVSFRGIWFPKFPLEF